MSTLYVYKHDIWDDTDYSKYTTKSICKIETKSLHIIKDPRDFAYIFPLEKFIEYIKTGDNFTLNSDEEFETYLYENFNKFDEGWMWETPYKKTYTLRKEIFSGSVVNTFWSYLDRLDLKQKIKKGFHYPTPEDMEYLLREEQQSPKNIYKHIISEYEKGVNIVDIEREIYGRTKFDVDNGDEAFEKFMIKVLEPRVRKEVEDLYNKCKKESDTIETIFNSAANIVNDWYNDHIYTWAMHEYALDYLRKLSLNEQ